MKRRWIALALLLALAVGLTACQVEFIPHGQPGGSGGNVTTGTPPSGGGTEPGTPDDTADPADGVDPVGGDEDFYDGGTDYTMEKYRKYLSGEWIAVEGEIEGDRYRMEEEGMTVTLEFQEADGVEDGRGTWSMGAWYEYTDSYGNHEKLDGLHVRFHKGAMYDGCANEEWYVELMGGPEDVKYTVTVIDNNYLELHRYVEDSYVVWIAYFERADGRWWSEDQQIFIDRNYYKEKEIT